jgi:hypothetical protein
MVAPGTDTLAITRTCGRLGFQRGSSHCEGGGNCVEIALLAEGAAIRDSKNPAGPELRFPTTTWQGFLARISE